jgi:hypothetical protein
MIIGEALKLLHALMIAMLLLGATGLLSDDIGKIIGPIEYNGYLGYSFSGLDTTVITVTWNFVEEIGSSRIIVNVPTGWSYSVSPSSVTLTGGSLAPGEDLQVKVSFIR